MTEVGQSDIRVPVGLDFTCVECGEMGEFVAKGSRDERVVEYVCVECGHMAELHLG